MGLVGVLHKREGVENRWKGEKKKNGRERVK